jgi:hypothetical protein
MAQRTFADVSIMGSMGSMDSRTIAGASTCCLGGWQGIRVAEAKFVLIAGCKR